MRAEETIRYLYGLQRFGIKSGLVTIGRLLEFLGHPERAYPTIHIAGTNGKGSTSSTIASVLTAAGFRTGLYTSPHLIDFTERIRIDGRPVPKSELVRETLRLRPLIRSTRATFFEATTAIAFEWFGRQKVEIAVIETGLGGRLDATNVITPLVSVITNIGRDHTEYLGSTIRSIAREKAGIIKEGVPIVTAAHGSEAMDVLRARARAMKAPLAHALDRVKVEAADYSIDHTLVEFRARHLSGGGIRFGLGGRHQIENLRLAIAAIDLLPSGVRDRISARVLHDGLENVKELSGLRARLEPVLADPLTIVDVAHNPPGIEAAMRSLRELVPGKFLIVFGVMKDKEYGAMLGTISPYARLVVAVRPHIERALPSGEIVEFLHKRGIKAINGGDVKAGVRMAMAERRADEPVVILGSHYVAGEALKILNSSV